MKLLTAALGVAATLAMLAYVVPTEIALHSNQVVFESSVNLEYVVVVAWIGFLACLIWLAAQAEKRA